MTTESHPHRSRTMTSEHTLGRTYPREWYRVNEWGAVSARTFIAETGKKLRLPDAFGRKRYENKASSWYWWHPTLEEAEAHAAKIKSAKDERAAAERVRNAAPDLLRELKGLVAKFERWADTAEDLIALEAARAAISRAEGRS